VIGRALLILPGGTSVLRNMKHNPAAVRLFVRHIENIYGGEPIIFDVKSMTAGVPGIKLLVLKELPLAGVITTLTYGVSLVKIPGLAERRVELCISVRSSCIDWAISLGYLSNKLRGHFDFSYGKIIDFGEPLSRDSPMDGLFVYTPSHLTTQQFLQINVGLDYNVDVVGLYPMYSAEMDIIRECGVERFVRQPGFDKYDINRKRIRTIKS
jgi:hypothetical protein